MKRFSGKTILVVDDEAVLRGAIKEELEYEGAQVFDASNGTEAFELIKKHKIDAVISDVRMPGGSGIELLDHIKELNVHAPVVLLMTAYSDLTTDEAYAKGVEAILSKPFDLDDLIARIYYFLKPIPDRFDETIACNEVQTIQKSFSEIKAALSQNEIQMGRGGIFIKGDFGNEKPGLTQFRITFSSGEILLIEGQGSIRWIRKKESENTPCGIGIEFHFLPENIRSQILKLIQTQNPLPFIPNGKIKK